jgi:hypothetical protein
MSRVKTLKREIGQDGLNVMFNSILSGEGDEEIVKNKFTCIMAAVNTYTTTLNHFADSPFKSKFPEYASWSDEFKKFSDDIKTNLVDKSAELDYSKIKNNIYIRNIILSCAELNLYEKSFTPGSDLYNTDKWITTMPGHSFKPFKFSEFDVKQVWNNVEANAKVKQLLLITISILFTKAKMVYNVLNSPDIDVQKFSSVIIDSIDSIQSLPELNRCRDAFKKIKDSVNMLETNFGNYYKDMVDAKNPNLIIENFILDVSKKNEMKPELMRQFRVIISFYKKQSSTKIKDPNVSKLFSSLDDRMNKYDVTNNKDKKSNN